MIELQALQSNREEMMARLHDQSSSDNMRQEALDAVHAIDQQLGATALFVVDRHEYHAPMVHTNVDEIPLAQQEVLF
jgi:hypothetical protein